MGRKREGKGMMGTQFQKSNNPTLARWGIQSPTPSIRGALSRRQEYNYFLCTSEEGTRQCTSRCSNAIITTSVSILSEAMCVNCHIIGNHWPPDTRIKTRQNMPANVFSTHCNNKQILYFPTPCKLYFPNYLQLAISNMLVIYIYIYIFPKCQQRFFVRKY